MKNNKNLIWVFPLILFAVSGCYEAPEFPAEPKISYKSVKFYDVLAGNPGDPPPPDSLVVAINFQDGDGDLGLEGDGNTERGFPYHSHYYVTTDNRLILTPSENTRLLGPSSNDTMPPFNECVDYRRGRFKNGRFINFPKQLGSEEASDEYNAAFPESPSPDTFYIKPNIFAFNFLLDFLVKKGDKYEVFDWNEATASGCADNVNGTFPPLYEEGSQGNPLSGELSYAFSSRGYIPYFRNDTVKLRVRIIDRALNISNTVETPPFYFVRPENTYQIKFLED